jgi:hypothetical protein
MSALRGCGFALGASYSFGAPFGVTFGVLSTAGQAIVYRFGMRPTAEYKPATRLRLTRFQLFGAVNRTVGYAVTGYVSSLVAQQPQHAIAIGLRVGLAIGVVTAISSSCTSFIEWFADHVPAKHMGVFGVALILVGFALQSVQYWMALLDVAILSQ